jgi:hypothetical protein
MSCFLLTLSLATSQEIGRHTFPLRTGRTLNQWNTQTPIWLDDWLSLKLVSDGDGGKSAGTKYGGGDLVNKLCNKTVVAVLDSLAKTQEKQMLLLSAAKAKAAKAATKAEWLCPVHAAVQEQLSALNQGPSREAPTLSKDIAWELQQLSAESLPIAPG